MILRGQFVHIDETFLSIYVCANDPENEGMMYEFMAISVRDKNISDEDREKIIDQVQEIV